MPALPPSGSNKPRTVFPGDVRISELSGTLNAALTVNISGDIQYNVGTLIDNNSIETTSLRLADSSGQSNGIVTANIDGDLSVIANTFIDGSGAATQVPYFSDSDTLTGENGFTYNDGTQTLSIGNTSITTNQINIGAGSAEGTLVLNQPAGNHSTIVLTNSGTTLEGSDSNLRIVLTSIPFIVQGDTELQNTKILDGNILELEGDTGSGGSEIQFSDGSNVFIKEFSDDVGLVDSSSQALVTENAVKTYVDNSLTNSVDEDGTGATNQIAVFADADTIGSYNTLTFEDGVGLTVGIGNDVTIEGNLYVNGTEFIVNTEAVSAQDNIILINAGEVGNGVTKGYSGIRVDRGLSDDYYFVFDEDRDGFVVGVSTDETSGALSQTQLVATREDSPNNNSVPFWNNTENRFDTDSDMTYNNSTNILTIGDATIGTGVSGATLKHSSGSGGIIHDSSGDIIIDGFNDITLNINGSSVALLSSGSVELSSGTTFGWNSGTTTVTDIVTSIAVTGASDDNLVTEAAIRTAIDSIATGPTVVEYNITATGPDQLDSETMTDGGIVWYYVLKDGTNYRMGHVMAVTDGSTVEFTEMTTTDIGNTSSVTFEAIYSGGDIVLQVESTSGSWDILVKKNVIA